MSAIELSDHDLGECDPENRIIYLPKIKVGLWVKLISKLMGLPIVWSASITDNGIVLKEWYDENENAFDFAITTINHEFMHQIIYDICGWEATEKYNFVSTYIHTEDGWRPEV